MEGQTLALTLELKPMTELNHMKIGPCDTWTVETSVVEQIPRLSGVIC